MTQADLARATSVSLAMIKAVERGARTPSDATLDVIAGALGVDPSRLVTGYACKERRVHAALPELSAVLAAYDSPLGQSVRTAAELRRDVKQAEAWRLAAQYGRIAEHVPTLLADTLRRLHSSHTPDAARLVFSTARTADAVAYKYRAHDLSARLVDLMRWAAAQADDPMLSTTAAYVRTETFFAAQAHEAGLRALEAALDAAPSPHGDEGNAARGALHMRAAVIAGRAGDDSAAALHLAEAEQFGDRVREDVYQGTAFGPDSVRIHAVSVAVGLGGDHVSRALEVAEDWKPPEDLPAERCSGFYIELARAQLWSGLADDAFASLTAARRIAPQHTREHPWAKHDTATLRRLKRADAESLTRFAEWIGAV